MCSQWVVEEVAEPKIAGDDDSTLLLCSGKDDFVGRSPQADIPYVARAVSRFS